MRKIALIPAIAAAFAIASCQPKAPEATGDDVNASVPNVAVETNATDNGAVAGNAAATNEAATSNAAATNEAATSNAAATNQVAASSSIAPQSYGSGSPTGGKCGGIIGRQCASHKDFCKLPDGQCKVADAQGTCTTRPHICPMIYKPVCGCDHKTYGNACQASAAGVSVQSQGACPKS